MESEIIHDSAPNFDCDSEIELPKSPLPPEILNNFEVVKDTPEKEVMLKHSSCNFRGKRLDFEAKRSNLDSKRLDFEVKRCNLDDPTGLLKIYLPRYFEVLHLFTVRVHNLRSILHGFSSYNISSNLFKHQNMKI